MTWALLGLVATFGGWAITASIWLKSANRDKDRARDAMDKWKELATQLEGEKRLTEASTKALMLELEETRRRLIETEKQRNEAMSDARDHFVKRLEDSNVADAAHLVRDLLADEWPRVDGVLPPRRSDDPKDGLLDPSKD